MKKSILGGALFGIGLCVSGCGSAPELPSSDLSAMEVDRLNTTKISIGEVSYVRTLGSDNPAAQPVLDQLPIVDHVYPADDIEQDSHTPEITDYPVRFTSKLVIHSEEYQPEFANDKACDSYKIPEAAKFIVAMAIGDSDQATTVAWPTLDNGEPAHHFDVCFLQGSEPKDGIVLYYE